MAAVTARGVDPAPPWPDPVLSIADLRRAAFIRLLWRRDVTWWPPALAAERQRPGPRQDHGGVTASLHVGGSTSPAAAACRSSPRRGHDSAAASWWRGRADLRWAVYDAAAAWRRLHAQGHADGTAVVLPVHRAFFCRAAAFDGSEVAAVYRCAGCPMGSGWLVWWGCAGWRGVGAEVARRVLPWRSGRGGGPSTARFVELWQRNRSDEDARRWCRKARLCTCRVWYAPGECPSQCHAGGMTTASSDVAPLLRASIWSIALLHGSKGSDEWWRRLWRRALLGGIISRDLTRLGFASPLGYDSFAGVGNSVVRHARRVLASSRRGDHSPLGD
jgi:hypothetical protein